MNFSMTSLNDAEQLAQAVVSGDFSAAAEQAKAMLAKFAEMREEIQAHEGTIAAARSNYADDDVEVDDVPVLSVVPGEGVWVSAWVWVPIEEDANDCAECARSYGPHYTGPCSH